MRGSLIAVVIALGLILALSVPALAQGPGFAEDVCGNNICASPVPSYSSVATGGSVQGGGAQPSAVALTRIDPFAAGSVMAYADVLGGTAGASASGYSFGGGSGVVGGIAAGFEARVGGLGSVKSYSEHASASGVVISFTKMMGYN